MNKLKKSFLFYFGLFFLSILFYQCCTGEYKITGSGEASIFDITTSQSDTISNQFIISTSFEGEVVLQNENKVSLFQSAWATSCDYEAFNPIDEESILLSFSQDFIYLGNTISSGTNILDFNLNGLISNLFSNEGLEFHFTTAFINNVNFPNGDYEITISAETSDGIQIENRINTNFKFN